MVCLPVHYKLFALQEHILHNYIMSPYNVVSNEGRINVLLWYCLVGAYVGLPLGVVGSPGGKWLRVVR